MIFLCLKYEHIYSGFNFNFCNKSLLLRGNRLFNYIFKIQKGESLFCDLHCFKILFDDDKQQLVRGHPQISEIHLYGLAGELSPVTNYIARERKYPFLIGINECEKEETATSGKLWRDGAKDRKTTRSGKMCNCVWPDCRAITNMPPAAGNIILTGHCCICCIM